MMKPQQLPMDQNLNGNIYLIQSISRINHRKNYLKLIKQQQISKKLIYKRSFRKKFHHHQLLFVKKQKIFLFNKISTFNFFVHQLQLSFVKFFTNHLSKQFENINYHQHLNHLLLQNVK
jgi:hypothetical protein